jgi:hypothetical protein
MAVSLPQGAVNELHADEREHKKDCDEQQHQHNAEGDYTLLSSFASDVPRHARSAFDEAVVARIDAGSEPDRHRSVF